MKRGQIGTEYLIIISFVVFIVLTTLGIAVYYTSQIQDSIKMSQLEKAAKKIVYTAETTFYDGQNAKATIDVSFPEGLKNASIISTENRLYFEISTQNGLNRISYKCNVPISGTLPATGGVKLIHFNAGSDHVDIS
jgi:hypothetical protein